MATQTLPPETRSPAAAADARPSMAMPGSDRIVGLRCRNCGQREGLGVAYVCAACFGPLEVEYNLASVVGLDRATSERRPPGIWRYL